VDQVKLSAAIRYYSNVARARAGLPALQADPMLDRVARGHAQNMARLKTHSHTLPVRGQQDLKQRLKRLGVPFTRAAENIARDKVYQMLRRPIASNFRGCSFRYSDTGGRVPIHTYASLARTTVDRWMRSPGHRQNILSRNFTRVGNGVGYDASATACGDFYLAQNFAN
jgi:uncharacterized protein YkwD